MILVINKIDCAPASFEWPSTTGYAVNREIYTCAVTGQGIPDLEAAIVEIIGLNSIATGGRKWTINQVCDLPLDSTLLFSRWI